MTKTLIEKARALVTNGKPAKLPVPPVKINRDEPEGLPAFLDRAKWTAEQKKAHAQRPELAASPKPFLVVPKTPEDQKVLAEIEAAKKAKTGARIANLKAKKAGDTQKMPLTGKAALAAIAAAAVANGQPITKVPQGARSPGEARLKASGKAEALREETAAMQKAATSLSPKAAGKAKGKAATKANGKPKAKAAPAKKATSAPPKATKKAGGQSKSSIVRAMLAKGATRKAIAEAADWPSINLKRQAEIAGKRLVQKDGIYRMV